MQLTGTAPLSNIGMTFECTNSMWNAVCTYIFNMHKEFATPLLGAPERMLNLSSDDAASLGYALYNDVADDVATQYAAVGLDGSKVPAGYACKCGRPIRQDLPDFMTSPFGSGAGGGGRGSHVIYTGGGGGGGAGGYAGDSASRVYHTAGTTGTLSSSTTTDSFHTASTDSFHMASVSTSTSTSTLQPVGYSTDTAGYSIGPITRYATDTAGPLVKETPACPLCNNSGWVAVTAPPPVTVTTEDLRSFAAFLVDCGGYTS